MTVDAEAIGLLHQLAAKLGYELVPKDAPPPPAPTISDPVEVAEFVEQTQRVTSKVEDVVPPGPATTLEVQGTNIRVTRTSTMKAGSVKPKGICRLLECDKPWMPKTKPGRPPEYCSPEHKVENQRRADAEARARKKASAASTPKVATKPVPAPASTLRTFATTSIRPFVLPPEERKCGRCDSPEHSVIDCPEKYVSKKQRRQQAQARPDAVRVLGKDKDKFDVVRIDVRSPDERRADREHLEEKAVRVHGTGGLTDEEIGSTGYGLVEKWRKTGLPKSIGFSYLPDVLALWGLDQDMVESCLRSPDRVELRPESYDAKKRFVVIGFFKGDVNVILGLRDIHHPMVIAVYVTSLLENDHHRVDHTGGGGKKKQSGPPKTPGALRKALLELGCDLTEPALADSNMLVTVRFRGQELGAVRTNPVRYDRRDVESDWNRIQRKVHAIRQREQVSA